MKNAIIWMGKNPVVANMIMVLLLASGYISLGRTRVESLPDFSLDQIIIQVPYLGASPQDVEEGVCKRIEERLTGMEGIRRIRSVASENIGVVTVELDRGTDMRQLLDNIKQEVDRIDTFPEETEKPIVKEITRQNLVIDVVIYGDVPERTLKTIADRVRDDLRSSRLISRVDLVGVRADEISIEVSEENLRRYGLTFDQLHAVVAQSSLDMPGGSVKGEAGEILVRSTGLKNKGQEYRDIVIITRPDGTYVTLGQIAHVVDGFEESDLISRFNGNPAAVIQIFRVGDQNQLEVSEFVHQYIETYRPQLPAHVSIDFSRDASKPLNSRLNLVLDNAWMGLILVFICLSLFLELHLAFWVMLGIPISFLGCFILVQPFGASINMISLFGFIIALGIVVDDAIVVGESVFSRREKLDNDARQQAAQGQESDEGHFKRRLVFMRAAIDGALDVSTPVLFSVLTTLVGFVPLLFVGGMVGKLTREIPIIVIPVLCISLIESLFILPAHLTGRHGGRWHQFLNHWLSGMFMWHTQIRNRVDAGLKAFTEGPYRRVLTKTLSNPLATVSLGVALLLVSAGWVVGGHTKFVFFPKVDANWVSASLTMPLGTTAEQTAEAVHYIEHAAANYKAEQEKAGTPLVRNIYTFIGDQPMGRRTNILGAQNTSQGNQAHLAEVTVELMPSEIRESSSTEVATQLRKHIGEIPGIESLSLASSALSVGNPIEIEMTSPNTAQLLQAVEYLKAEIAQTPGTSDIQDSYREGKQELRLSLKPQARTLGFTQASLSRQVRQGFYGAEALRFQRGSDDVRVMLRYPESQRKSLQDIKNTHVRTPRGVDVPLLEVAHVEFGRGPANIYRSDGQSVVTITADVNTRIANASEINYELNNTTLPSLVHDYPGLKYRFVGQRREQQDSIEDLISGYTVALVIIAGLLAIPFRSYVQPLVIMSVIPFSAIGALIGHILLGMDLTILSMLGFLALSGVVVNDSMLLVDRYNQFRQKGQDRDTALVQACSSRFRPIILTSFTTFFGLLPMILERSVQAQFLIPMAVSLGVGLVFATLIVLIGVPALLKILVQIQEALGYQAIEDETVYMLEEDVAQQN